MCVNKFQLVTKTSEYNPLMIHTDTHTHTQLCLSSVLTVGCRLTISLFLRPSFSLSLTLFRSYLTSRASAFWRLIELQICLPHKQQIFHFITRANLAVYQFCISGKLINILSARLLKEFVTPRILDCLLDFCLVSAQFEC